MVILVTGGAGFIGGNFINYLYRHHADTIKKVICLDSLEYSSNISYIHSLIDIGFVKLIQHDIYSIDGCEELDQYQFDYIVNFAAETHVDNSISYPLPFLMTNELGTYYLLDWTRRTQTQLKKFIHVSTDEVYGSLTKNGYPFREESTYSPNSPYSASKAASDHWVRAYNVTYGLPTIITNCSNNYGPNQHKEKFIPKIITNALNDKPIPVYGTGNNIRDWLYVDDHCSALWSVLQRGQIGQKYNIGGGTELTNNFIVNSILELLGKSTNLIEYVQDRPGHDFRYAIDCRKIEQELGYQPKHNFVEGLEKTIGWYEKWQK